MENKLRIKIQIKNKCFDLTATITSVAKHPDGLLHRRRTSNLQRIAQELNILVISDEIFG
jgi:type II secretory pathway component PulK